MISGWAGAYIVLFVGFLYEWRTNIQLRKDIDNLNRINSDLFKRSLQMNQKSDQCKDILVELLKSGQHEGACTNADDGPFPEEQGCCHLHVQASERRKQTAEEFLKEFK